MDIEQIKALVKIMDENGLVLLETEENGSRIKLQKKPERCCAPEAKCTETSPEEAVKAKPKAAVDAGMDFNSLYTVKAPMIGVFYSAPGPNEKPFVTRGAKVNKGDVVCIIEAMKLMNEIQSEYEGEIVDVLVADGDIVEYGQPLFKIF